MKQVSKKRLFLFFIISAGFAGMVSVVAGCIGASSGTDSGSIAGDLAKVESMTAQANPEDFSGYAFRSNLVSISGQSFFGTKQIPPVWGRVSITKQLAATSGFFYAAMVILLFFIFYQKARTGSGSEGDWVSRVG